MLTSALTGELVGLAMGFADEQPETANNPRNVTESNA